MTTHRFPDLLGIGTQRSGTTWLWRNLSQLPALYAPHFKELHYLNRTGTTPHPLQQQFRLQHLHEVLAEEARGTIEDPAFVRWFRHFALSKRNDDAWYKSLFLDASPDQLALDFTPAYCRMPPTQIARTVAKIPHVRVILMLRDPIDRAWSQLHLNRARPTKPPVRTPTDFQRWCQSRDVADYNDYQGIIERWKAAVGHERLFVGYYEDIQARPLDLLHRLARWLDVPFDPAWVRGTVDSIYNRKAPQPIPEVFARAAAPVMVSGLQRIARANPGPPRAWLARCTGLLGLPPP